MEVVTSRQMSSSLNPNAPLFVPRVYRDVLWAVEDFSDEWWELVHSSPWFRDYWFQECFQDPQIDDHFLPEIDQVFDGYTLDDDDDDVNKRQQEEEEEEEEIDDEKENVKEEDYYMDLVSLGALKWRRSSSSRGGGVSETPKYLVEKVPRFVNVNKVNPRPIQQPR